VPNPSSARTGRRRTSITCDAYGPGLPSPPAIQITGTPVYRTPSCGSPQALRTVQSSAANTRMGVFCLLPCRLGCAGHASNTEPESIADTICPPPNNSVCRRQSPSATFPVHQKSFFLWCLISPGRPLATPRCRTPSSKPVRVSRVRHTSRTVDSPAPSAPKHEGTSSVQLGYPRPLHKLHRAKRDGCKLLRTFERVVPPKPPPTTRTLVQTAATALWP